MTTLSEACRSWRRSRRAARWICLGALVVLGLKPGGSCAQTLLNRQIEVPFNPLYVISSATSASISGSLANGWSDNSAWADVNLVYSQEPAAVHEGNAAQRIDIQRVGTGGAMQFVQPIAFSAGRKVMAAIWMRASSAISVNLILRQAFGGASSYATTSATLSPQWQRYSVSGTTPSTETGYLMVQARTSGTIWLDDATIDSSSASVPPLVEVTSPSEAATFASGTSVTITASATDSDGTVSKVDFYRNGVFIASGSTAPYTITWANPGNNIYPLSAIATDNSGATGSSSPVKIAIGTGPALKLSVTDPDASKYGPDPAAFAVTRSTTSGALQVRYSVSGNALGGADYLALSGSVIIPDGQTSAEIVVTPIATGTSVDPAIKTVSVTLSSGSNYLVDVSANNGTVSINPSYAGREPSAAWRTVAAAGIEQNRKGNLLVQVKDQLGNPLPNASIHVQMTRHAFGFGVAVDAAWINANTADAQSYRAHVLANFNRVVFGNDLKWPAWESNPQPALTGLQWAHANGLAVRGHNLIWPSWSLMPSNVQSSYNSILSGTGLTAANSFLHTRILDHISSEATTVAGQCVEWDVLNEPYAHHDVQDILGQSEMASWYYAAQAADPAAKLFINDYNIVEVSGTDIAHQNSYFSTIDGILSAGAPLDGIGFQSHFSLPLTSPDTVTPILDRFAGLGKTSEVTEFDVNTSDETIQADYLRDYLTLVFSRPEFNAFVIWGFWQATLNKPNTALFHYDWTAKASANTYRDLVFNQWWTDVQGASDGVGRFSTRGFCGSYQIAAASGTASASVAAQLGLSGTEVTLTLSTPPFEAWQRSHSSAGGVSADPDGDGIPNLAEYALGLDPEIPSGYPLHQSFDSGHHLTLSYTKSKAATDVVCLVEVSDDLVTWRSGSDWVEEVVQSEDASTQTLIATDKTQSLGGAPRRFIRLRVTRP